MPDSLNERAIGVLDAGPARPPVRHPARHRLPGRHLRPRAHRPAGGRRGGPEPGRARPDVDHHAVHVRQPHGGEAQKLHGDAIIDIRPDAFDIQLMYYPQEVTLEQGGTLSVPGSHLRRINETDTGRYQNLRGQTRLTCPAGTVVLLHHGIWHGGRRNDSDQPRYMFKIRFNPTVRQLRLWGFLPNQH